MSSVMKNSATRDALLRRLSQLARRALFGTLSETYRTCGRPGCRCQQGQKRSEEHTSELQSRENLVCRLLLEKKNRNTKTINYNLISLFPAFNVISNVLFQNIMGINNIS